LQAHASKLRNTKWFVKKNKTKQKFGRSIYILYISKEFELFIAKKGNRRVVKQWGKQQNGVPFLIYTPFVW
jgi:hypothetical protein